MLSLAEVPETEEEIEEVEETESLQASYDEAVMLLSETGDYLKKVIRYLRKDKTREGKRVREQAESALANVELFVESVEEAS